tara:strand:+ start:53 stop:241 length:189 start_codon:yes stop_codon:yes gene_type:complete
MKNEEKTDIQTRLNELEARIEVLEADPVRLTREIMEITNNLKDMRIKELEEKNKFLEKSVKI